MLLVNHEQLLVAFGDQLSDNERLILERESVKRLPLPSWAAAAQTVPNFHMEAVTGSYRVSGGVPQCAH